MKVTLLHNPSAGKRVPDDADDLVAMIRASGHQVVYQSLKKKNWRSALDAPTDLVVVAGGDGAVNQVGRLMVGMHIPLAVLPRGKANNIARTLEVNQTPLPQLIESWSSARRLAFDVGIAKGPWGEEVFLESLGIGLFAWTMPRFDRASEKTRGGSKGPRQELQAARRFLHKHLAEFTARQLQIKLDGHDLSGDYLLLEAMNIRSIGPNLFLAPDADPGDGLLDVVLVPAHHHDKLIKHLKTQPRKSQDVSDFTIHRGKGLRIQGKGSEFHLDDRPWPEQHDSPLPATFSIDVRVKAKALVFLVHR